MTQLADDLRAAKALIINPGAYDDYGAAGAIDQICGWTGWQPIETAPKDGTWILGIVAGTIRGEPFVPMSVRWHPGWEGFLDPARYHAYESRDEDAGWEGMADLTHWMPLPPLPAPDVRGGE